MLIAQPDPVVHMEPRKSWNRAFSSMSMKEYEIIVAKRVRQLAGCLEDLIEYSDGNANGVVDMAVVEIFHISWVAWRLSPNHFSESADPDPTCLRFGGGFEIMKAGRDVDGLWVHIEAGISIATILSNVPYSFSLTGKKSSLVHNRQFCRDRTLKLLRVGAKRKDILYYLRGEELPVLAAALYYLIRNVIAYERLLAEVDGAFPSGEEPLEVAKSTGVAKLLHVGVRLDETNSNETLLLQPPVPSGTLRSVHKGKGTKRYHVHPGSFRKRRTSALHTYSIQLDPRNFHRPDAFLPEPWLSTGAPAGERNTAAFFPFFYGLTNCAGKNLMLMEMRTLLCWMLRRFRFSGVPGANLEECEGRILDWMFVVHQVPLLLSASFRD
ncbi:Cytochrome P450 [Lactarius tabidus]